MQLDTKQLTTIMAALINERGKYDYYSPEVAQSMTLEEMRAKRAELDSLVDVVKTAALESMDAPSGQGAETVQPLWTDERISAYAGNCAAAWEAKRMYDAMKKVKDDYEALRQRPQATPVLNEYTQWCYRVGLKLDDYVPLLGMDNWQRIETAVDEYVAMKQTTPQATGGEGDDAQATGRGE